MPAISWRFTVVVADAGAVRELGLQRHDLRHAAGGVGVRAVESERGGDVAWAVVDPAGEGGARHVLPALERRAHGLAEVGGVEGGAGGEHRCHVLRQEAHAAAAQQVVHGVQRAARAPRARAAGHAALRQGEQDVAVVPEAVQLARPARRREPCSVEPHGPARRREPCSVEPHGELRLAARGRAGSLHARRGQAEGGTQPVREAGGGEALRRGGVGPDRHECGRVPGLRCGAGAPRRGQGEHWPSECQTDQQPA
eukprot:COSAG04_NODE_125_length_24621_cov_23.574015_2_plen_254_part_00